ncbi:Uncharacterized protein FWK35_00035590, partial [Aphis craccivora]
KKLAISSAYSLLTLAYKYLLTFPVTQVSFERFFFTLKYLKKRLRNSMTNDNLEAFIGHAKHCKIKNLKFQMIGGKNIIH